VESKPDIYYISDRIYPSGNAGGVRIFHIANMLKNFFNVHIVTFNNKSNFNYHENNIFHYIIPLQIKNKFLLVLNKYLFSGVQSFLILRRIIRANSHILVYSTNIFFLLPLFYFKFRGHKLLFDVVENYSSNNFFCCYINPKYYLFRFVYAFLYPRSDGNFCISSHIRNYYSLDFNTFILPPLYKKRYNQENSRFDRSIRNYSIIYSGMPFGKENLSLMFKILDTLLSKGFNFDFHFTGIEKKRLLRKTQLTINYPFLSRHIFIHGFLSQENLHNLYKKSHFTFFLRNNYQSNICCFPMKLIEMMNFGIIPIISNTGDYGSNLTDVVNSFVFQNLDEEYCIKKFSEVLHMDKDKLSRISLMSTQFVNDYDPSSFYQTNKTELTNFLFN
jgi:glycosyltransferase involved in cell wall biosynthesis